MLIGIVLFVTWLAWTALIVAALAMAGVQLAPLGWLALAALVGAPLGVLMFSLYLLFYRRTHALTLAQRRTPRDAALRTEAAGVEIPQDYGIPSGPERGALPGEMHSTKSPQAAAPLEAASPETIPGGPALLDFTPTVPTPAAPAAQVPAFSIGLDAAWGAPPVIPLPAFSGDLAGGAPFEATPSIDSLDNDYAHNFASPQDTSMPPDFPGDEQPFQPPNAPGRSASNATEAGSAAQNKPATEAGPAAQADPAAQGKPVQDAGRRIEAPRTRQKSAAAAARIAACRRALAAALRADDHPAVGAALANLGIALAAAGEYDAAFQAFLQAAEIAHETDDRRAESARLGNLGLVCAARGQPDLAASMQRKSLELAAAENDSKLEAAALGRLGLALEALGAPGEAEANYRRAAELCADLGDRRGQAMHLGRLASAALAAAGLGDLLPGGVLDEGSPSGVIEVAGIPAAGQAIDVYRQALAAARQAGDPALQGNLLAALAGVYARFGDPAEISALRLAADVVRQAGDPAAAAARLFSLGQAYLRRGDQAAAQAAFKQAEEVEEERGG